MRKIYDLNLHIKVWASIILTILGGLIYLMFRDKSLIMFSWARSIRLNEAIDYLRYKSISVEPYYWIKYNMPAGLWLFSYMLIIDAIWGGTKCGKRVFYIYVLPISALLSEFMQLYGLCPGTFDVLDVISYLSAIILFKTIKYYEK